MKQVVIKGQKSSALVIQINHINCLSGKNQEAHVATDKSSLPIKRTLREERGVHPFGSTSKNDALILHP